VGYFCEAHLSLEARVRITFLPKMRLKQRRCDENDDDISIPSIRRNSPCWYPRSGVFLGLAATKSYYILVLNDHIILNVEIVLSENFILFPQIPYTGRKWSMSNVMPFACEILWV
jgi:hypothetical protein